jgi:hypothetical protein
LDAPPPPSLPSPPTMPCADTVVVPSQRGLLQAAAASSPAEGSHGGTIVTQGGPSSVTSSPEARSHGGPGRGGTVVPEDTLVPHGHASTPVVSILVGSELQPTLRVSTCNQCRPLEQLCTSHPHNPKTPTWC